MWVEEVPGDVVLLPLPLRQYVYFCTSKASKLSAPAGSNKEEVACLSVVAKRRRMVKVAVALGVAVELLPPSTVT